jgi:hypothetical protein
MVKTIYKNNVRFTSLMTIVLLLTAFYASSQASAKNLRYDRLGRLTDSLKEYDTNYNKIKSLIVGNNIPDIHIPEVLYPDGTVKSIKISDYKDQLLILHFWDVEWDHSYHVFPTLVEIQKEFKNEITILPVTYLTKKEVSVFLDKDFREVQKQLEQDTSYLPTVINDKTLMAYFKHDFLMHDVWIYKGKVVAITFEETGDSKWNYYVDKFINRGNIHAILKGEEPDFPMKNEKTSYNYNEPLFHANISQDPAKNIKRMYSSFSEYIQGINTDWVPRIVEDSINQLIRTSIPNRSIFGLYQIAYGVQLSPERIVWEVKDPCHYRYHQDCGYPYFEWWNRENAICYESVLPLATSKKEQYQRILDDIKIFFRLQGHWEKRKVPCFVIVQTDTDQQIKEKKEQIAKQGGYIDRNGLWHKGVNGDDQHLFQEMDMKHLVSSLSATNKVYKFDRPIVNESSYEGTIIISEAYYKNVSSLKNVLQECGFNLLEKECETDMYVFSEIE